MKRVLLITYAFPPQPSPGALRPGYLARYLPEFGWEATVVTRSFGEPPFPVDIFAAGSAAAPVGNRQPLLPPGTGIRGALGRVRDMLAFPDDRAAWIPSAVRAGLAAMRRASFDAIVSTALPMSAHVAAAWLSRISGTPWLADYRDAWSGNPYMPWGPIKTALERSAERYVIKSAAQVTTVSAEIAQQLTDLHARPVAVIPNAYDAAEWAPGEARPGRFNLIFAGNLYDGKRSPDVLFQALRELRDAGHPAGTAAVDFYSANNIGLLESAKRYGVEEQVRLHGLIERSDVMRRQRESALLLILLNVDPRTAQETGSKYLEYLAAKRPILVCGPPQSVMRDLVASCGLGWFASNVIEAKSALCTAYARYEAGDFEWQANTSILPSARDLARNFAQQLECVRRPQPAAITASDSDARRNHCSST